MSNSKKPEANSLDNYKPMLDERAELAMSKKRIEERIKELDELLRPVLEGRGDVIYNGYSFNCKLVAGRKTLDKGAVSEFVEQHGAHLEDFEKVGAPYTTFTVKRVNEL